MSDRTNVTTIDRGGLTLHVFTSPDVGEMVNSHVVETPNALVVVDVPLYRPFADEFRAYVDSLGKPIAKVLVTHAHPDHWFTLAHFRDHETHAFAEAIEEMTFLRELAIGYHTSIHPDLVPEEVVLPSHTIEPGTLRIDGVDFVLHKVLDAEATATMAIEIPQIRTLLAQDLVYHGCHRYLATKTADGRSSVDSWIGHLEAFKARGFELVVPGHGVPTDASVFDENIEYLSFARGVLASAKDGPELIGRLKERYPDLGLDLVLTMSAVMLYPPLES
jgi:glyoxylase-like metal-dependent hydrolase (beta-lactamase superfamily II)